MKKWQASLAATVLVTSVWVTVSIAQPGGIVDPVASAPALQPGSDVLSFSGAHVTLLGLEFVGKDCEPVSRLPRGSAALKLCDGNWSASNNGIALRGSGPGSIRCDISAAAQGLVLKYVMDSGLFSPAQLSLNGSSVSLNPIHGRPRETLVRLTREGGSVRIAGQPSYNLWDLKGTPPGPRQDEVNREIVYAGSHNPLKGDGYSVRVSFVAREESIRNPQASAYAQLDGVDVTQYDGYIVSVKSPDATYFSTSLGDSNGYGWSGAGLRLEPGEWTSLAVPFDVHRNYATAGDGVLKLAQLRSLTVNVGGRPGDASPIGEYWARNPVFYKGEPPAGIPVAEKADRTVCAVRSLSPARRKPHYFEGVSIQTISQQGDSVWLGTDRGIIKSSRSKPGIPMAKYSLPEGLVDDDVHAIHADGDALWIGTTCGLSRFDGETFQNFTSADGLLPGPVMAITHDDKYVWLGMARGIARYDKSSGEIVARKGHGGWAPESTGGQGVPIQEGRGVYADSIAVDPKDGTVWHGAAGVWHSGSNAKQLTHFLGNTHRVLSIHPRDEGIWLVSAYNIELIDRVEGLHQASYGIGSRSGIYGERHPAFITCAYPEDNGIWLGYSDGLGWFDPQEKRCHWSPHYSVSMGSLVPQCLFADSRNVWVGTDNGLLVFSKEKAADTWTSLEYSAPTDIWAAGVDLQPELTNCEDGCGQYGAGLQSVTLDDEEGAPGSPGALLLTFALSKDADSAAVMSQRFDMPLNGANAVSFCAKTDGKSREFFVDVRVNVKQKGVRRSEVWRAKIEATPTWKRFTVPFAKMRLVSGNGRGRPMAGGSIHLTGVDFCRKVGDFHCPGDTGKFWVDQLTWKQLRGRLAYNRG